MKFLNKKAFSLIELVVSMTIFFLMVMVSYVPYNFYMNKLKVKTTIKEISQILYETRNMAVNWISDWTNKSIWLWIDLWVNDNVLKLYSYPFSFTWSQIINQETPDIKLIKTYSLTKWMGIKKIAWKDNILFYFDAITWNWKYFFWDSSWIRNDINLDEIEINFSYKNALETSPLFWKLKYFTKTNIVDY